MISQKIPRVIARFWKHVTKTDRCWIWDKTYTLGYGVMTINYRHVYAHRFSYELHVGPIPKDKEIDHICWNRACVRPDHLRAVSHKENLHNRPPGHTFADVAIKKRKTHCKYGHPFTPENVTQMRNGRRSCRACDLRRHVEWHRRRREKKTLENKAKVG